MGARRELAPARVGGGAVGTTGRRRVPRTLLGERAALRLPAARAPGAARPDGGTGRLVSSSARRRRDAGRRGAGRGTA